MNKVTFIQSEFANLVSKLNANDIGIWGKMNAQQMIEHVADFFKVSYNKINFPLVTPLEHLPKFKEFLLSDKEFRENTKAPILPEEPFKVRNKNIEEAVSELKNDISEFFIYFKENETQKSLHPVFGELSFEEWVKLHYKHTQHHAKQFNLI